MRLIYSGNDYKYDTEAIMKLFLPAQRFGFEYGTPADLSGDFAFLRKRVTKGGILLYSITQYGGRRDKAVCRLPLAAEDECSERLSRLLYETMSRLTGITSEWGILTGVRPVKQVHRLLAKGMSREEVFAELSEKYLVSDKKCRGSAQERINSLAGTQFTVCYYKGLYDASSIPEEASAIWVIQALQTQEGTFRASLDEEHFVSGDSLYTVGGKAVLPLGTFTIRETKAADGYENDGRFADAEMYIGQIRLKEDGSGPEIIDLQGERSTANSFEVLDTPMTPRIGTRACDQATGTHTANTAGPERKDMRVCSQRLC